MCAKRQDGGNSNFKLLPYCNMVPRHKAKVICYGYKVIKTHKSKHMPWFIKSAIIFAFYFRKMLNFVHPDFAKSAKITM